MMVLQVPVRSALIWWLICFVGLAGLLSSQAKAKIPSWRGPDTFFDGTVPTNRSSQGIATFDDGRIYIFGGDGEKGEKNGASL
jgi:hypothetical protein